MTDDPILSINPERAAAQRRLSFKRYLRRRGVSIPQDIIRNEAALRALFHQHRSKDNDPLYHDEMVG